jgi:hypothetical protein
VLTSGPKSSHLHQMKFNSPIRIAVRDLLIPSTVLATLCCGASVSHAQSTKPSTPFAVSTSSGLANNPKEPQLSVDYVAGNLVVTATNASLNQILSQVSRSIGMKITGSVADERVYGEYGPSTPSNRSSRPAGWNRNQYVAGRRRQGSYGVDPHVPQRWPDAPQPNCLATEARRTSGARSAPAPSCYRKAYGRASHRASPRFRTSPHSGRSVRRERRR